MKELFTLIARIIIMGGVYITFAICAFILIAAIVIIAKDKFSEREHKSKT